MTLTIRVRTLKHLLRNSLVPNVSGLTIAIKELVTAGQQPADAMISSQVPGLLGVPPGRIMLPLGLVRYSQDMEGVSPEHRTTLGRA